MELEQFTAEQYILQNYSNKEFNIKIFNDNWIKIADSNNPYLSNEVSQSEIPEKPYKNTNISSFIKKLTLMYLIQLICSY